MPDFKHVIYLGCSDSRHIGELPKTRFKTRIHVISNAGAEAGEDLETLVKQLNKKGVKSNEILLLATAHYSPKCGGAHISAKTVKKLKNDLAAQGFGKEKLATYLNKYNHNEKSVFSPVPAELLERAKLQAQKAISLNLQYLTGKFSLHNNYFIGIYSSLRRKKIRIKFKGDKFTHDKELRKHQKPKILLLSVLGRRARTTGEEKTPGKVFHVSVNPEKPSAKTILSLIYYLHLNPDGIVRLKGTREELKRLKNFVENDDLLQHMLEKGKWTLEEKTIRLKPATA